MYTGYRNVKYKVAGYKKLGGMWKDDEIKNMWTGSDVLLMYKKYK